MNDEGSSSTWTPGPVSKPQQYGLSSTSSHKNNNNNNQRPMIVRQTPPSVFRTPSHRPTGERVRYHPEHSSKKKDASSTTNFLRRPRFQDSPFASPLPSSGPDRPVPLILDPEKRNAANSVDPNYSSQSKSGNTTSIPVVHKLFEAAARGIREHTSPLVVHQNGQRESQYHAAPTLAPIETQAATLARTSSHAGFLFKLGANIPEFKRRFFVLRPETNLYYYLSPGDTEPRGKIDVEGSWIEEVDQAPDGRYRFAIVMENRRVVLEARNKEMAQQWIKHLENDRVSTLKDKVERLTEEKQARENEIKDLKRQIENFKMIEKDRDGALEDARRWKKQFERLDEALRRLTQRVRKAIRCPEDTQEVPGLGFEEEKKETTPSEEAVEAQLDTTTTTTTSTEDSADQQESAEGMLQTEKEKEKKKVDDLIDIPGRFFSSLNNACQQLRESMRLASIEASTAVEDVQAANERVEIMQKRMDKAEKHLTKLWEENCSIRKTLKQKKREKKVLIREVKALQQTTRELQEERPRPKITQATKHRDRSDSEEEEEQQFGSDEERLIFELEEHVASSIRLHERLLAANDYDFGPEADVNTSTETSDREFMDMKRRQATASTWKVSETSSTSDGGGGRNSPIRPTVLQSKLSSLVDTSGSSSELGIDLERAFIADESIEFYSDGRSISSVGAELGDFADQQGTSGGIVLTPFIEDEEEADSPPRKNPLSDLDKSNTPSPAKYKRPSSDSAFVVTENGQATSRLECPLADVTATNTQSKEVTKPNEELWVYHLTFYSQKIGIQFQKAPPTPIKPKGLLTDAMTADLVGQKNGSMKTAAELRGVAAISSLASKRMKPIEEVCSVATPKDIVLVCGFHGFDDSGMNQRPKLGARLVAFDGISVEVGQWTFEGIRKAIKARGRPLTLSFRNDYLTTEQRAVLTKAVMDVDAKCPPRLNLGYRQPSDRPPSMTPSLNFTPSHETDYVVNDGERTVYSNDDEYSASAASSISGWNSRSQSGSVRSAPLPRGRNNYSSTLPGSISTQQLQFRSFSEAGASSVISSTLAPFVANLMKGVSSSDRNNNGKDEDNSSSLTPEYLHKKPESPADIPQHRIFESNLL